MIKEEELRELIDKSGRYQRMFAEIIHREPAGVWAMTILMLELTAGANFGVEEWAELKSTALKIMDIFVEPFIDPDQGINHVVVKKQ